MDSDCTEQVLCSGQGHSSVFICGWDSFFCIPEDTAGKYNFLNKNVGGEVCNEHLVPGVNLHWSGE